MNPTVVFWILAVAVAVLVGREVGKWLFGTNEKLMTKKRAAQKLAGNLAAEYVNTGADHFAHSLCYADIGLALAPIGGNGENVGKVT